MRRKENFLLPYLSHGTLQDAENFFELRRDLKFKDGRKLSIEWKKQYDTLPHFWSVFLQFI